MIKAYKEGIKLISDIGEEATATDIIFRIGNSVYQMIELKDSVKIRICIDSLNR